MDPDGTAFLTYAFAEIDKLGLGRWVSRAGDRSIEVRHYGASGQLSGIGITDGMQKAIAQRAGHVRHVRERGHFEAFATQVTSDTGKGAGRHVVQLGQDRDVVRPDSRLPNSLTRRRNPVIMWGLNMESS